MQDLLIAGVRGPVKVQAQIVGPFAIHRAPTGIDGWTVTHLFTGLAIVRGRTVHDALTIARTLPTLDDWYFGPLDMGEWNEHSGSRPLKARVTASLSWLNTHAPDRDGPGGGTQRTNKERRDENHSHDLRPRTHDD